jgi:hypothetical protein
MKRIIAAAACVLALAGCVSAGTKIDPATVSAFQPGVTSIGEAEAKLGTPNQVTHLSDGQTIVVYMYIKSHASGASYIPVVGIFAGKSIADNVSTTLVFDKAGKFARSTTGEGHTEAGLGG